MFICSNPGPTAADVGAQAFTPERLTKLTGKARKRYAALGAADRFEYVPYDGGHAFRTDMRERSYAWLDRWLRA